MEPPKLKDYLALYHPSMIKEYLWVNLFLINFFGLIIATCDPFIQHIYNIIVPIIVFIDLWAFYIMLDVFKRQVQYVLFSGCFCLATSFIFMVIFYKVLYFMVGVRSLLPLLTAIAVYLVILVWGYTLLTKALKSGSYSQKLKANVPVIVGFSAAGPFVGRILVRTANNQVIFVTLAFVALFLGYILILGMHNIYKYYLIKQYPDLVKLYKK